MSNIHVDILPSLDFSTIVPPHPQSGQMSSASEEIIPSILPHYL